MTTKENSKIDINIGVKYKLTSDTYNVIVNERTVSKPKEGEEAKVNYKSIGFYPNLEKACVALLDKDVREAEVTTIKDLLLEIKNSKLEILAALTTEKAEYKECYRCEGKGVGLDWGAMNFWECDVCKGTGETI